MSYIFGNMKIFKIGLTQFELENVDYILEHSRLYFSQEISRCLHLCSTQHTQINISKAEPAYTVVFFRKQSVEQLPSIAAPCFSKSKQMNLELGLTSTKNKNRFITMQTKFSRAAALNGIKVWVSFSHKLHHAPLNLNESGWNWVNINYNFLQPKPNLLHQSFFRKIRYWAV